MKKEPTTTFLSELCGIKVTRGRNPPHHVMNIYKLTRVIHLVCTQLYIGRIQKLKRFREFCTNFLSQVPLIFARCEFVGFDIQRVKRTKYLQKVNPNLNVLNTYEQFYMKLNFTILSNMIRAHSISQILCQAVCTSVGKNYFQQRG